MNRYPLRRLFPVRGMAMDLLDHLRRDGYFKSARVTCVCTSRSVNRLVIGIGQAHPVLSGRVSFFQRRDIARSQYWILQCCRRLHEVDGVIAFGQEGLSVDKKNPALMRLSEPVLADIRSALEEAGSDWKFVDKAGKRWNKALRKGREQEIETHALSLHALTLLQALYPSVRLFGLEEMSIHHSISTEINALQMDIARAQSVPAWKQAMGKNGRNLQPDEYKAMQQSNQLIEQWNALLESPKRDSALWQNIEQYAKGVKEGIAAVFVLGEGHRDHFLKMMTTLLPPDVLFVWVTPPALLFWQRVRILAFTIFGIGMLIVAGLLVWHGAKI